jgi:hypothetical protein
VGVLEGIRDVSATPLGIKREIHVCDLSVVYAGKPQLQLNQLLNSFFLHDTKYTVKMAEVDRGLLAKHPDNIQTDPDFMAYAISIQY